MMQTHLHIRVKPGQRDAAIAAFKTHRIFEGCHAEIAGFHGAELLLSPDEPDLLCVVAHWQDSAAAAAWMDSPVRAAQNQALSHFLAAPPEQRRFLSADYALHSSQPLATHKGPNT
jgi:quinol monooxygenase YgiN